MLALNHLQLLLLLQKHGSLAAAADELCITASAVSHKLKELESYYGVALVNRRTRPLSFTMAGQELLALGEQVLPKIAKAEANLLKIAQGQAGRLSVASECHSCFDWLMPALVEYRRHSPEVEIELDTAFEPNPHILVQAGEIDVLITSTPSQVTGVQYLPLFDYESILVVAHDHALASKACVTPQQVAAQTLICYPVDIQRLDVVAHFLAPAGLSPSTIRHADLLPMIIQLVASGRGVAGLPDWVVGEYVKKGWVVSCRMGEGVHCKLYAAIKSDGRTHYVDNFLQILTSIQLPPS